MTNGKAYRILTMVFETLQQIRSEIRHAPKSQNMARLLDELDELTAALRELK